MPSNYVNAPATRLVATRCAVCSLPLVDAQSVETGIGPLCRHKYGYDTEGDPALRESANLIVYQIALDQTGPKVREAVQRLREFGYAKLADRIVERLDKADEAVRRDARIVVAERPNGQIVRRLAADEEILTVATPYDAAAVDALRRIAHAHGGTFTRAVGNGHRPGAWAYPNTPEVRRAVRDLLRAHYPGAAAVTPRGPVRIPAARAG